MNKSPNPDDPYGQDRYELPDSARYLADEVNQIGHKVNKKNNLLASAYAGLIGGLTAVFITSGLYDYGNLYAQQSAAIDSTKVIEGAISGSLLATVVTLGWLSLKGNLSKK